jgi:hypothetical protein
VDNGIEDAELISLSCVVYAVRSCELTVHANGMSFQLSKTNMVIMMRFRMPGPINKSRKDSLQFSIHAVDTATEMTSSAITGLSMAKASSRAVGAMFEDS